MNTLAPVVGKIAPLVRMLGSPVDGEALAACRALGRTLAAADLDFHHLAAAVEGATEPQIVVVYRDREPRRQAEPGPGCQWRDLARRCLGHLDELRPPERKFLRGILRWRGTPTPKQRAWLTAIAESLELEVPA